MNNNDITDLDKLLYEYYKKFMNDNKLSITMQLYDIKSIEDFKKIRFYKILYKEMRKEMRKEKLNKIINEF